MCSEQYEDTSKSPWGMELNLFYSESFLKYIYNFPLTCIFHKRFEDPHMTEVVRAWRRSGFMPRLDSEVALILKGLYQDVDIWT